MNIKDIDKNLTTLKIHLDQLDEWISQASDMIYAIDEVLFAIKDKEYFQKYELINNMEFLKKAAPGIYQVNGRPPGLNSSRCGKNHIAAEVFYQDEFELK